MTTPEEIIKCFDDCLDYVFGRRYGRDYPGKNDAKYAKEWIGLGLTTTIAAIVFYDRMRAMHERWLRMPPSDRTKIPQGPGHFDENIRSAIARAKNGGELMTVVEQSDSRWTARVNGFLKAPKLWLESHWGPPPGHPGCRVPQSVMNDLAEAKKKTDDIK